MRKNVKSLNMSKTQLRDLVWEADSYDELKLNLVLKGWNLDDKATRAKVKDWMAKANSTWSNRYFQSFLRLGCSSSDIKKIPVRVDIMKGLWKDCVGEKDREAAKVGMMMLAEEMSSSNGWNTKSFNGSDKGFDAVAQLIMWLGEIAYSGKKARAH